MMEVRLNLRQQIGIDAYGLLNAIVHTDKARKIQQQRLELHEKTVTEVNLGPEL
jgi:hypothetical protein